uniref:RNA-directed DNA polymerase n=1 Tax=Biju errantivirus TaxID=3078397 RepID=A0AB38Z1K8_9VIRU
MVTMPYINLKTNIGNFPFLIDTGANINLINPQLAYSYKIAKPYDFKTNGIASANSNFNVSSAIDINFFYPKIDHPAQFLLHRFHKFFCGIIGTTILNALCAKIDLESQMLTLRKGNDTFTIPLLQYRPDAYNTNSILEENAFRLSHLSSEEKTELLKVLKSNEGVFHKPDSSLSCSTVVECTIETEDKIPIFQKTYPYPQSYKDVVEAEVAKMLKDGIIRPSRSPWNSPVWVVTKKEDASGEKKFRLVIDYRTLNKKTKSDKYPMPEISHILDQLGNNKYFTTLDLASGFHQIKMNPKDIEKTAFSVNNGKYEFLRMPFGLKNGPAIFQRAIDDVLRKYIGKICYVYIDDVIVFGKTFHETLKNLNTILRTLNDANLKVQLSKSEFLHDKIEFLGYIVSANGIQPNGKKIETIAKYPCPKNLKELRSFLGMMSYYRRFIKDFAKIAKPLTNILRNQDNAGSNKIIDLGIKEKECFENLKKLLSSSDILAYPNFKNPFILTTDASDFAIGAVLSQEFNSIEKPIHFASRTLSKTEEKYSAPEKEMLAIFWALQTFRNYLYGTKVKILTDHQPLTFALSKKNTNAKLKRWKAYLEEHDHEIIYKPGKTNVVADALSRITCCPAIQNLPNPTDNHCIISTEAPINVFKHQVIIEKGIGVTTTQKPFPGFTRIKCFLDTINKVSLLQVLKDHFVHGKLNGLLTDEQTMLLLQEVFVENFGKTKTLKIRHCQKLLEDVEDPCKQEQIIQDTHNRAHRGADENIQQIFRRYYFPKFRTKTKEFVTKCQLCNETKYDRTPSKCLLQATPIPTAPFEIVHMDILFLENHHFLTYLDKFSKFAQVVYIPSRAATDIAPVIRELILRHRTPKTLVMDGEKSFMAADLVNFYKKYNITPYITATGRSEMNGIVERFHSTIVEIYRITRSENQFNSVKENIALSVQKYNATIHSSTGYTPLEIITPSQNTVSILDKAHKNLIKKQKKDLNFHNKNRKTQELIEGQEIFENTRQRLKHKPRFKKKVIQNVRTSTVMLKDGRKVHKNDLKVRGKHC